jgi:hypothetical protein
MRKTIKSILFVYVSIGIYTSCSTNFRIQAYDYIPYAPLSVDSCGNLILTGNIPWEDKSIILLSDTTLNYFRKYGSLGYINTIGYTRLGASILVDSVDEYNSNSEDQITRDIIGKFFLYTKDSLVEIDSNQLYYRRTKSYRKKYNTGGYLLIQE